MQLKILLTPLKLDYINPEITDENVPDTGERGECIVKHYGEYLSSEQVLKKLDNEGLRPVTVHEMLIWADKGWDGKTFVVALGSVWVASDGDRCVSCLRGAAGKRHVYLRDLDSGWLKLVRFLAVRKSSAPQTLGTPDLLDRVEKIEKFLGANFKGF